MKFIVMTNQLTQCNAYFCDAVPMQINTKNTTEDNNSVSFKNVEITNLFVKSSWHYKISSKKKCGCYNNLKQKSRFNSHPMLLSVTILTVTYCNILTLFSNVLHTVVPVSDICHSTVWFTQISPRSL